jgi:diguanylate cyclase (GGDEF)-like protein
VSALHRAKYVLTAVAVATALVSVASPATALEVNVPGVSVTVPSPGSPQGAVEVSVSGTHVDTGLPGPPTASSQPLAAPTEQKASSTPAATGTSPATRSAAQRGAPIRRSQASVTAAATPTTAPIAAGSSARTTVTPQVGKGASSRPAAATTPTVKGRTSAARGAARPRRSRVDRIVQRIPSEFLGALCAALLAALAFAVVWLRERRRAQRARHVALIDPLTGIPNRLAFYERFSHEWGRARRYERELGVILLDMDGLKQLNDGHGHAAGDQALTAVAETISSDIRESDLAARLAGDEFVVLCPETGGEGLSRLGDKLRTRLDARGVGMSVGVADYETEDRSPEDLLARADEAMYRDKAMRGTPRGSAATGRQGRATQATPALPAS